MTTHDRIRLMYDAGLAATEIADILGRHPNSVRQTLHNLIGKPLARHGGKLSRPNERRRRLVAAVKARVWSTRQGNGGNEHVRTVQTGV